MKTIFSSSSLQLVFSCYIVFVECYSMMVKVQRLGRVLGTIDKFVTSNSGTETLFKNLPETVCNVGTSLKKLIF